MANEILKEIKTKIALKVLTYTEWDAIKDTYKPLRGEVCFCEIPEGNTAATNAPTVLFKVGDGQKTFGELNWASALAADVHGWAKAANAPDEYDTKYAFEIVKAGTDDNNEVLKVTETTYKNGVAGDPVTTTIDVVTHNDLATVLLNYYNKSEVESLIAAAVAELANGAVKANTEAIAAEVTAREEAVAVVERAVKTETARALAAEEANAKAIADEALRAKDAEGKNAGAIADEAATRKAADETLAAGIAAETVAREEAIAVVERAVKTEAGRAQTAEEALQAQITANTNAITTLTDGIDPDKIDGLTDLVKWADEHAPEVASIKGDIEEVAANLNAYESKLGFVTTDDKTVAEVIDETFAKKAEIAAVKVDEAAHADEADHATEADHAASATDADHATEADDAAKLGGKTPDQYATAEQGAKADTALQNVEVGTGLKVANKVVGEGEEATEDATCKVINIDTDVIFVLDCNW